MRLPPQEEMIGKRGKPLTLTIRAIESMKEDGARDDLAVGLKIASGEPVLHLSGETVVEVKTEKNTLNSDFYSNCNSYETLIITIRVHLAPEMAFEAFHYRHGRVCHMRSFNHKQKRWDTD